MYKEDTIIEIEKFLKKLNYKIENDSKVSLFGNCIIEKIIIDDILCCIDSSIPQEYKDFIKKHEGTKTIQSNTYYKSLCNTVKQKLPFNSDYYIINIEHAKELINCTKKYLISDINFIFNEN